MEGEGARGGAWWPDKEESCSEMLGSRRTKEAKKDERRRAKTVTLEVKQNTENPKNNCQTSGPVRPIQIPKPN